MLKRILSIISILGLLLLVISCGGKKADLQSQAVLPDKTLFENGMAYVEKGHHLRARLAFQTLINTYDDSEYLEKAKFYIAYSYWREGGIENLIQAEQAFKDFRLFFPTSELADNAQAHVVEINMKLMRAPNRDQTHTFKAFQEIRAFLKDFPTSPLVPEMGVRLQYVEDVLAMSEFHKGNFYYKKELYKASAERLRVCVQKYDQFGRRDEALFLLADSLDHLKNYDESAIYYSQIVRGYPFSDYFEKSKERLRQLERPIPDVDRALAEANLQYYYTSKSIWTSPFRTVFGIFGLGDEEKPWKEMEKDRREQEKENLKAYELSKNT
ncbi:MAG: outer membrane protein assembly factor BamD [Acidobacteria bacterium]|nr:outer membrane protein assembly factor BamD [Acidobacteriota bacterium]